MILAPLQAPLAHRCFDLRPHSVKVLARLRLLVCERSQANFRVAQSLAARRGSGECRSLELVVDAGVAIEYFGRCAMVRSLVVRTHHASVRTGGGVICQQRQLLYANIATLLGLKYHRVQLNYAAQVQRLFLVFGYFGLHCESHFWLFDVIFFQGLD